ncbi:MAG TPA: Hsp20/alpha crystallin family protein [Methylibium sp.]|uniref:Hsp20/alpha crystallin family protein n=1 Tax=Methylibium sp. TaxID=2067992 RepID=UPI002DBBC2F3|nr:Hsp20/alpha crystallin family protein [Methylibium sp.]HEU4458955.1 Hsp20/alpha crystallin family protein [Methylibium sp.]
MLYRSFFDRDVFRELDRLQSDIQQALGAMPSIRGGTRGFPALNLGTTPRSVELVVFAPGLDPGKIDLQIDRGVLTIAGERSVERPAAGSQDEARRSVHIDERFAGRFRRVVSLPDDVDASNVKADYRDGVLHISIARQEAAQPRRIEVH